MVYRRESMERNIEFSCIWNAIIYMRKNIRYTEYNLMLITKLIAKYRLKKSLPSFCSLIENNLGTSKINTRRVIICPLASLPFNEERKITISPERIEQAMK